MKRIFFTGLIIGAARIVFAQLDVLQHNIEQLLKTKKATVGVSILGLEDKTALSVNGTQHYPMQSVFKFHIALAILNEVDKGKLSLEKEILISKSDLAQNMYSPIRDAYPDGIKLSIKEILRYTVSLSDNIGCDILLKQIGGPKVVNDYIHGLGVKDVSIQLNEAEMHQYWEAQFRNWSTPPAATGLLKIFASGKILSKSSHDFLWKVMTETPTGRNRITGKLPAGTTVTHKTGTSDTSEEGVMAAVNDIGIVTLPDGQHFAIAVFVSNSKESIEANEEIIADISKLAWDYFLINANNHH
ncbi:MAG TPA: class A beta-lactamase, subclass A2 [Cyclobacteriaceae bacterium]|nr:class A beta-lactamase, subclass A2 [Cyclobacteriaceae bacterium]